MAVGRQLCSATQALEAGSRYDHTLNNSSYWRQPRNCGGANHIAQAACIILAMGVCPGTDPCFVSLEACITARRPSRTTNNKVLRGNQESTCSVYVVPGSWGRTHRFSGSSECLDQIFMLRGAHGDHTHVDRVRVVRQKAGSGDTKRD